MKEEVVVRLIEKQLASKSRLYNNLHGTMFSKNGSPDFITMDTTGRYLGIEAKAPKKAPYTNQWRRAIEILLSGGRYIVAQEDFDLNKVDLGTLSSTVEIGSEIGYDEFLAEDFKINCTTEVLLKD